MHPGPFRCLHAGDTFTWLVNGIQKTASMSCTCTICVLCGCEVPNNLEFAAESECVPLCFNCLDSKYEHTAGWCLFRPTKYLPIPEGIFDR